MKLLRILKKNFKLLIRSKMTALVVVVAPLLIILLAGIAFNDQSGDSSFIVAVYQEENSSLTQSFVKQLENNSFIVSHFQNEESCKNSVKQANSQACIVFPKGFDLSNDQPTELKVYADYSRRNFVFYLVESVSRSLETRTSELSLGLTNTILDALYDAKQKNTEANLKIVQLKSDLESLQGSTESLKSKLNALNVDSENVGITNVASELDDLKEDIDSLRTKGVNAIENGAEAATAALDEYGSFTNETEILLTEASEMNDTSIENKHNETIIAVDALITKISSASDAVKKIETKLANVKTFKSTGTADLDNIKSKLESAKSSAEQIKTSLEAVNQKIDSIEITSAEKIIQPITTKVEPVVTETTNINYMFSYLVMLIVMFVSILLSSTTIIMEKKSKAYFRNFTTPTSDFTFTISTYLTTIIIIFLQLSVLFGLANFVLDIPVLNNIGFSLLALFIGVTLFAAIGMGIGYWFSSQEAVIMLSMSVASIFLLVSNLILPLEVLPESIQMIASFNPYVMLSELLRKIIIFNIIPETIGYSLIVLSIAAIIIFLLIMMVQKVSKFAYFKKLPHTKKKKMEKKKEDKHHKSFKLYEKTIENEIDLLNELKSMDDETFETYVNKDKNDFYNWAKYVLKDKNLAALLKVKTRQEMIDNIENK